MIEAHENKRNSVVGDLGYDGTNGNRAEAVMQDLTLIIEYFEERLNEKIP